MFFFILIIIFIVIVFTYIFAEYKKYNDPEYLSYLEKIDDFFTVINKFNDYITCIQRNKIILDFQETREFFKDKTQFYNKEPKVLEFNDIFSDFHNYIQEYNENYIQEQKEKYKKFFNDIEGKNLDNQQRKAILTDEYSNLIIAGAGSGKTLTIIGKVKFLLEHKNISPSEILLLSFTKKTVEELNTRFKNLKLDISATTFHKLGNNYLKKHKSAPLSVANESLITKIINEFFKHDIFLDHNALFAFVQFIACYLVIPEENDVFTSLGEKIDINKGINFETLKSRCKNTCIEKREYNTFAGEKVKSSEELIIANFLFFNGIEYEYEKIYPHDCGFKYNPDFYLPKYKIYLEHFGINEEGKTPWLTPFNEKKYIQGIEDKRNAHKKHKTKLLETYSYYNKNNVLLEKLRHKLEREGVVFKPFTKDEIKKIFKDDKYLGKELETLIKSFIHLSKSKNLSYEEINRLFQGSTENNDFMSSRQHLFITFALPLLKKYNTVLKENNEIDFNDMINEANKEIQEKGREEKYKYIIIDEYQDISFSRFKFIKTLRDISQAKLICVGDDWQSIYRFTGSDISLFHNFEKYFGEHEKLFIENTYRNSQELIDISSSFIQKNPLQIQKKLKSKKTVHTPLYFIKYDKEKLFSVFLQTIENIIKENGKEKEILILGRHKKDIKEILEKDYQNKIKKYDANTNTLVITDYENVNIKFITVHSSKGIESDNVIILNMENNLYGFPNKLTDDPLLSLLLSEKEEYRFAEERRLFYVALTRTKNKVYLFIPKEESLFIEEIKEINNIHKNSIDLLSYHNGKTSVIKCTWCKTGNMVIRKNSKDGKLFLGCSHFPICNQTYNDIEILENTILCPSCESGYLISKSGRYGAFLGCSNFPNCKNTINIR